MENKSEITNQHDCFANRKNKFYEQKCILKIKNCFSQDKFLLLLDFHPVTAKLDTTLHG